MLDFNFWSIFWSVLNIIILFIVLRIFLFKPVNKIMDERTRSIQNDIDTAKKDKEDAEELKRQYENDLGNAKNERKMVIRKAQTEIADLAIEAASKIIGENVDDEKNRRLVDEFLSGEEDSAE